MLILFILPPDKKNALLERSYINYIIESQKKYWFFLTLYTHKNLIQSQKGKKNVLYNRFTHTPRVFLTVKVCGGVLSFPFLFLSRWFLYTREAHLKTQLRVLVIMMQGRHLDLRSHERLLALGADQGHCLFIVLELRVTFLVELRGSLLRVGAFSESFTSVTATHLFYFISSKIIKKKSGICIRMVSNVNMLQYRSR